MVALASPAIAPGARAATPVAAGTGALVVARRHSGSVVTRAFARSPLRLLTPRNHGEAAWIYTATYGGGLVGGDDIHLDVTVEAGAMALISTQASTKVYRCPRGSAATLTAAVAADAILVVAPDPVMPFRHSTYQQRQIVDLEDGASLVSLDWLTSGRRAMGERWAFDAYGTRTAVRSRGRLIVQDALLLRADDGDVAKRMGRFDVLCTIVLAGEGMRAHAERIVSRIDRAEVVRRSDLLTGASRTSDGGCVARICGTSCEAVSAAIRDYLGFLPTLLGDDPWRRKW